MKTIWNSETSLHIHTHKQTYPAHVRLWSVHIAHKSLNQIYVDTLLWLHRTAEAQAFPTVNVASSSQNRNRNEIKIETNITITTESIAICFWPWMGKNCWIFFSGAERTRCTMKNGNNEKQRWKTQSEMEKMKRMAAVNFSRQHLGVCFWCINRCLSACFFLSFFQFSLFLISIFFSCRFFLVLFCVLAWYNCENGNETKFNVILWWKTHYIFIRKMLFSRLNIWK